MLKNHYRQIKSELGKIVQGSHRKAGVHREVKNGENKQRTKNNMADKGSVTVLLCTQLCSPKFLDCLDLCVPMVSTCVSETAQWDLHVRGLYDF